MLWRPGKWLRCWQMSYALLPEDFSEVRVEAT